MTPITIAVIDDRPLFREGVSRSPSETDGLVVVGEAANANDAVLLATSHRPDVLLLDVFIPGGGIDVISDIAACSPHTKVLMLTASEEEEILVAALRRGAAGYVLKGIGSRELADAIRTVVKGSRFVSPIMRAKAETPRELEVIELVAGGLSNKRIGRRLNLHEKNHQASHDRDNVEAWCQ